MKCKNIYCRDFDTEEENKCVAMHELKNCDQRKMYNRLMKWKKTHLSMHSKHKEIKLEYKNANK